MIIDIAALCKSVTEFKITDKMVEKYYEKRHDIGFYHNQIYIDDFASMTFKELRAIYDTVEDKFLMAEKEIKYYKTDYNQVYKFIRQVELRYIVMHYEYIKLIIEKLMSSKKSKREDNLVTKDWLVKILDTYSNNVKLNVYFRDDFYNIRYQCRMNFVDYGSVEMF
jgi:hypothetical protein